MSQENIDHDSKRKTDSKTCMPDVEEVSCETCFELIGKVTEENQKMENSDSYRRPIFRVLKSILDLNNWQEKTVNLDSISNDEISKILKDMGRPQDLRRNTLEEIRKVMKKDLKENSYLGATSLIEIYKFVQAMVEDLEKYADLSIVSLMEIYQILTEMDNEMNDILQLISFKSKTTISNENLQRTSSKSPRKNFKYKNLEKPTETSTGKHEYNSSEMSNDSETATTTFIEFLQKGKRDRIIKCLIEMKGLLEKQNLKASHLVALNCAVGKICNWETLLHIGLKFDETIEFTEKLMDICPKLLLKDRSDQLPHKTGFEGQTPLHVAIARDKYKAVQNILTVGRKYKILPKLLRKKSTGSKFRNTVLMGQLPLTVAALVCKNNTFDIIKTLLKNGARIWWRNENKDTVFHSLIQYADRYPEKMPHIQVTFKFLWEEYSGKQAKDTCKDEGSTESRSAGEISEKKANTLKHEMDEKITNSPKHDMDEERSGTPKQDEKKAKTKPKHILFWKNESKLSPLHLAAKLGVSQLFDYMVDIQYRSENIQDGLFDIREYDVTDFDRLIDYKEKSQNPTKLTVLERLFHKQCSQSEAFQMLNQELIKFILHKKWIAYRVRLGIWWFVHSLFMVVFTASIVIKAEVLFCLQLNQTTERCDRPTSEALIPPLILYILVIVIDFLFGFSYLIFFCLCIKKIKDRCFSEPGNKYLIYHNLDYVVCLLVIGVGALMEVFLIPLRVHFDFHLFPVLLCGWYFMLYFSPFSKNLVSFTHMIKKGFLEDFLPFGLVFIYLLVSFTGMMHMLYLGIEEKVDEFYTFQDSLLTMFNLGVGLNNIDVLNKARIPWLAYTVFVVFAILSFIHLFNAFIAVMSQTFSDVHTDKHSYHKYNRLRMIELFEDICMNGVFEFFNCLENAKHWERMKIMDTDENYVKDKSKGAINQGYDSKQSQNVNDYQISSQTEESEKEIETEEEEEKGEVEIYDKKRYYSVLLLLDDPKDDMDEREENKNEPKSKLKTLFRIFKQGKNLRRSRKRSPQPADFAYIAVDYTNKAIQCSRSDIKASC
ncbi:uncharacterized protein LOC111104880 isoform X2 [Crassostrea virginica]